MAAPDKKNKQPESKELSARILAVQACYQMACNRQPVSALTREYLDYRVDIEQEDGEKMTKPDGTLFKKIMRSLDDRMDDIEAILEGTIHKPAPVEIVPEVVVVDETLDENTEETSEEIIPPAPPPERVVEPLLRAILLCGIAEILVHTEIDTPLIIDDYLNVAHSFYDAHQVRFVNGVLDKVASNLR